MRKPLPRDPSTLLPGATSPRTTQISNVEAYQKAEDLGSLQTQSMTSSPTAMQIPQLQSADVDSTAFTGFGVILPTAVTQRASFPFPQPAERREAAPKGDYTSPYALLRSITIDQRTISPVKCTSFDVPTPGSSVGKATAPTVSDEPLAASLEGEGSADQLNAAPNTIANGEFSAASDKEFKATLAGKLNEVDQKLQAMNQEKQKQEGMLRRIESHIEASPKEVEEIKKQHECERKKMLEGFTDRQQLALDAKAKEVVELKKLKETKEAELHQLEEKINGEMQGKNKLEQVLNHNY
jgi:hypothetical protein